MGLLGLFTLPKLTVTRKSFYYSKLMRIETRLTSLLNQKKYIARKKHRCQRYNNWTPREAEQKIGALLW